MKYKIYTFFTCLGMMYAIPLTVLGAIPDVYTNDNFLTSTHEQPVSFTYDGFGGFYGYTVSGRLFTQTPVINTMGVKLQKFSIDKAFFYMSDKGQIWAKNDLAAISIYLTMG